jgi:hypothetical protein
MIRMKNCVRNRISPDEPIKEKKKVVHLFQLVSLMEYLFLKYQYLRIVSIC